MELDRFDNVLDRHSTLGHTPPPSRLPFLLLISRLLDPFTVTCGVIVLGHTHF